MWKRVLQEDYRLNILPKRKGKKRREEIIQIEIEELEKNLNAKKLDMEKSLEILQRNKSILEEIRTQRIKGCVLENSSIGMDLVKTRQQMSRKNTVCSKLIYNLEIDDTIITDREGILHETRQIITKCI